MTRFWYILNSKSRRVPIWRLTIFSWRIREGKDGIVCETTDVQEELEPEKLVTNNLVRRLPNCLIRKLKIFENRVLYHMASTIEASWTKSSSLTMRENKTTSDYLRASLETQMVKRLPTMWERVWSLGREDPLEKEMANHSSTLAWKIPWTEEPGKLQSMVLESERTEQLHFHFLAVYPHMKNLLESRPHFVYIRLYSSYMATHSSILTWRIPWTEEPSKLQSIGLQRVRHDWMSDHHSLIHL